MKNYSQSQKSDVINRYLLGERITEISRSTGVARSTIYLWINQEQNKQNASKKPINLRYVHDLQITCDRQRQIIEILKSATCTVSAPLSERYKVIESLSPIYSVCTLCKALNVAKGSYYNHLFRNVKENTLAAQKRAEITPLIEEIFHESKETYGSGKIHAILKDRGYKISTDTVANIMHANNWFPIGTSSKKLYLMNQHRKQNILNQEFTVSKPNEVWVSDITYFRYNDKLFYICVIIDLYARKVVGCRISLKNSTQLTKSTFKVAYDRRQPTHLLFHSDQGSNYTSNAFMAYLKALGVRQSFSRGGNPYDNSVMESFFKNMKAEELYRTNYHSEKEFRKAIAEYIHRYNECRPHSFLRYQTPNKYETAYFNKRTVLESV